METTIEDMSFEDIGKMQETLPKSQRVVLKTGAFLYGISLVILLVPMEILKFFTKRGARRDVYGSLMADIGIDGAILYIWLPIVILLFVIYWFGVREIKMDLRDKQKMTGIVRVEKIEPLDARTKKDLLGLAEHVIKFEKNPFGITDHFFLQFSQPESMTVKEYRVEVSRHTKVEFRRQMIS